MGAALTSLYRRYVQGAQRLPGDDEESLGGNTLGTTNAPPQKNPDLKANLKVIRKLLPYLWPEGKYLLRLRVVFSLLFLFSNNVWSVLTPITYKKAVDDLSPPDPTFPIFWVFAYCVLKFFSRASNDIRDAIFVKVSQAALKSVSLDIFNHLHALSLRFHLNRQTGGILRAIERGTSSASYLLSMILFNILPIFVEVGLTCVVLISIYDIWFTIITLVTVVAYVAYTISVTEWRNKFRRLMNEKDNESTNKAVDSLINFETVKYFCNEQHEAQRFERALDEKVAAAVKSTTSLSLLNSGQAMIIALGTLFVMLLAGKRATDGEMTVGDFVLVNTYMMQLYTPLNWLGTSYRMIKQSMVDLENLFTLLDEPIEVADAENARRLEVIDAEVKFKNVSFSYKDNLPIIKNVSFTIPSGHTVAVVGPTGSGKSTLARLLFRFYDLDSGKITVDDQDIARVRQRSLRKAIGVVPQDTVLFNETIKYNIMYGRPDATDAEVETAARLAQIHDFIMSLPEGYETKVGERGLRLSGGEKQRVSIARAILKDPAVMIFDEATSALDTHTEKEIQGALREVSKGRTTLVIAHRLSTIVDADEILVLRKGEVVERGTHEELLQQEGEYAEMWHRQLAEISSTNGAVGEADSGAGVAPLIDPSLLADSSAATPHRHHHH